jgi:hypothetical protein
MWHTCVKHKVSRRSPCHICTCIAELCVFVDDRPLPWNNQWIRVCVCVWGGGDLYQTSKLIISTHVFGYFHRKMGPRKYQCEYHLSMPRLSCWCLSYQNFFKSRSSEDGGSMDLRNVGVLPQHYAASQTKRARLEISPPWQPQNSY